MPATPKSALGGDKTGQYLQGSDLQGWFTPDITNDTGQGLGTWRIEEIVTYLKTGHNRITAATGPMAEAVSLSTAHFSDIDLQAIATYLKSLPGRREVRKSLPSDDPVMAAGRAIYRDQCSACHGLDGQGTRNSSVDRRFIHGPLGRSSHVNPNRASWRAKRGNAAEPTAPGMPSYGWQLDDAQVAAVLTYVRNTWGAAAPAVSAQDVARAKATWHLVRTDDRAPPGLSDTSVHVPCTENPFPGT